VSRTCTCTFLLFSFQLHDNALALHEYTRHERKRTHLGDANRFDGELDNFQQPELSSLVRLVCSHHGFGFRRFTDRRPVHRIWTISCTYDRLSLGPGYTQSDSLVGKQRLQGLLSANAKSTVPRFLTSAQTPNYCSNRTPLQLSCILALRAFYPKLAAYRREDAPWLAACGSGFAETRS
jgi:hypothetical protein